jgi:fatty-acyl-CoA synthase
MIRPKSKTLGDLLDEMSATRGSQTALVFGDVNISFSEWRKEVDKFARSLLSVGIKHGDRVAVLAGNRPEWLIAAFAIAKIGAVMTAVSTFSTSRELNWCLNQSGAAALIMLSKIRGQDFLAEIRADCPELSEQQPFAFDSPALPELKTVITIDGETEGAIASWSDFMNRNSLYSEEALLDAQASVNPEDICYILYTSGSTASPKGVMLAHKGVIENGFDIGERQHLTEKDRLWLAVPLFWSFGSANALPAIMTHGGTIVLQESFDADRALTIIRSQRCTVFYGMANMVRALKASSSWSNDAVETMRTGLTIGLPEDVAFIIETLKAHELCNVYGSTETYGNATVCDAFDSLEQRLNSQGMPLPGMDVQILDRDTREILPSGVIGEIAIKGHVTVGYYLEPEMTVSTFHNDFFLSGDLGCLDQDGRLYFKGRFKEMIKTGGINVAPLEVEGILVAHPMVKQAYVVGVFDHVKEEKVVAVVVYEEGEQESEKDLREFCREELASYKVPESIIFYQEINLPLTSTGKINKLKLKDELTMKLG